MAHRLPTSPCCSPRSDVAQAYPQIPSPNALNSGFGFTANFGNLSPGSHAIGVEIRDSSGATQTITHAVTVVRAWSSQFLDLVDLNGASAKREGQDVVLTGVRVRDKVSQQVSQITARLRWFRNLQGLGLVESALTGAATLPARQSRAQTAATGAEVSPIKATIESPSNGQTVAGIAVLRGWAFSSAGRTIRKVELSVDGNLLATVPCCSSRSDVAAGFPNTPQALNSGFGITVNYGGLTTGVHTLSIKIEDSAGTTKTLYKGVLAKRQGGITFVNQLDLSSSTVRIANGALVVEGAKVSSSDTPQPVTRIQRYRFDVSAQAFLLAEDSAAEIEINNTSCEINGDVFNLASLRLRPGTDGISLPEAIVTLNREPISSDFLITWRAKGTTTCFALENLVLTRGLVTLDGDVDGDGLPDVTLEQATGARDLPIIQINFSNITVRNLRVFGKSNRALVVKADPGTAVANVALVGLEANAREHLAIDLYIVTRSGLTASLSDVLVNNCRLSGDGSIISVESTTGTPPGEGGEVRRVTLVENAISVITRGRNIGIRAFAFDSPKTIMTQMTIANNTITIDGGPLTYGIFVGNISQERKAAGQTFEATITGNSIRWFSLNVPKFGYNYGIHVTGGRPFGFGNNDGTTQNTTMVSVSDNQINARNYPSFDLLTDENYPFDLDFAEGIYIEGSRDATSSKNISTASITGNEIQGPIRSIRVSAGSSSNILQSGQNSLVADIQNNNVLQGRFAAISVIGSTGGSFNTTETMIADNIVTNASNKGIVVIGGSSSELLDGSQDAGDSKGASNNIAIGTIKRNTIQQNFSLDINVIGGTGDSAALITNNVAKQTILRNIAAKIVCQDGLPSNRAECIFAEANTEQKEQAPSNLQREERAITVQPAAVPLLNQLDERIADFRARAQAATTPESTAELNRLAERLAERKAEVMLRQRQ